MSSDVEYVTIERDLLERATRTHADTVSAWQCVERIARPVALALALPMCGIVSVYAGLRVCHAAYSATHPEYARHLPEPVNEEVEP